MLISHEIRFKLQTRIVNLKHHRFRTFSLITTLKLSNKKGHLIQKRYFMTSPIFRMLREGPKSDVNWVQGGAEMTPLQSDTLMGKQTPFLWDDHKKTQTKKAYHKLINYLRKMFVFYLSRILGTLSVFFVYAHQGMEGKINQQTLCLFNVTAIVCLQS